jgi:hypothetical protein
LADTRKEKGMFRHLDKLKRRGVYRQTFIGTSMDIRDTYKPEDYGVFEVRRSDWDDKWQPWHGKGIKSSDPMICLEPFGYNTKTEAVEVLERWLNDVLIAERHNRRSFYRATQTFHGELPC